MKRCLLISRFNVVNFGDLAISNKMYLIIKEYFKTDRFNYLGSPYIFNDINDIKKSSVSKKIKFFNRLKKTKLNFLLDIFQNYKKNKRTNKKDKELSSIINEYDVVILAGGNMVMSLTNDITPVKRFDRYISFAYQNNKEILALDIGIGPFFNVDHAEITVKALNKCDYITFRDENSYNIFLENGGISSKASISIDPVFLYNIQTYHEKIQNNIALNIINTNNIRKDEKLYNKSINFYVNLTNKLLSMDNNISINLFITTHEDYDALNKVYENIFEKSRVNKIYLNGLEDLIELYNKTGALIGTRMHSMIIAYAMKLPHVGLSWQNKVNSYFELIDEVKYCYNLFDFENNSDSIAKSVLLLLDNKDYEIIKMKQHSKILNKKYDNTLNILKKFS